MNHMQKIAVAAVALVAIPTIAGAADISTRRSAAVATAPAPVMYNWTGFYIGGHAGYVWFKAEVDAADVAADDDAFFGGAQLGYNWQVSGSPWVWGVEADASFVSGDIDAFGTGRLRAGFANGPVLTYVTGGVSWAKTDVSLGSSSESQTHVGWAAGAGVEWAFAPQWTAKLEYLYLGLGSETYNIAGTKFDVDLDAHTVRVGLNYRFGY